VDRIRNRVMRTDFPKFFRKFIIVAVLAVIFSGAAAGIAFRAQIAEIVSYEKLTEVQDGRYDALDKGSKNLVSGHDMDKERGGRSDYSAVYFRIDLSCGVRRLLADNFRLAVSGSCQERFSWFSVVSGGALREFNRVYFICVSEEFPV